MDLSFTSSIIGIFNALWFSVNVSLYRVLSDEAEVTVVVRIFKHLRPCSTEGNLFSHALFCYTLLYRMVILSIP